MTNITVLYLIASYLDAHNIKLFSITFHTNAVIVNAKCETKIHILNWSEFLYHLEEVTNLPKGFTDILIKSSAIFNNFVTFVTFL